jgi:hypothetical protein
MLMLTVKRGPYQIGDWAKDDVKAHMDFMRQLNLGLKAAGQFVDAQGLLSPDQARIVRAGDQGRPSVTDGPFAESKEFLAGFWIIDVKDADEAYAIAARASAAPGPGGKPLNMPIEVRQVGGPPPTE